MAERASREIEIRLGGSGGQGLLVAGAILAEALTLEGLRVAQSQSFEPTSRGGMSRTDLVASDGALDYPLVTALDFALLLDQIAAGATAELLKPGALVVVDGERVPRPPPGDFALLALPLVASAQALGDARVANLVGLGALVALAKLCSDASLDAAIGSRSPARFADLNLEAARAGRELCGAKPSQTILELAGGGSPA
jgi:2-oxoglutarate ferredoxin oxidoreductase subunit gamma